MKKEPIFIQERKANFWRGFRACLALVLILHSIAFVIVYSQPKPDYIMSQAQFKQILETQCKYHKGEALNPDCAPGELGCCVK